MHQGFQNTYMAVITLLGRSSLNVSFEAEHTPYPYCLTTGKLTASKKAAASG